MLRTKSAIQLKALVSRVVVADNSSALRRLSSVAMARMALASKIPLPNPFVVQIKRIVTASLVGGNA